MSENAPPFIPFDGCQSYLWRRLQVAVRNGVEMQRLSENKGRIEEVGLKVVEDGERTEESMPSIKV